MQATAAATHASVEEATRSLAALARFLMGATGRGFMRELERLDLSLPQAKTLQLIEEHDALSIKAMSERLGLSEPAVSRGVEALVRRDLVERAGDPDDRRCKRVSLTPEGRKVFGALSDIRTAEMRDFVAGLDDEERNALAAGLAPLMRRPDIAALAPGDPR